MITKYLIENFDALAKRNDIDLNGRRHLFVVISPGMVASRDDLGAILQLLKELGTTLGTNIKLPSTYVSALKMVNELIATCNSDIDLHIVFREVNFFDFTTGQFWNDIHALKFTTRKNYVFVVYDDAALKVTDGRFVRIFPHIMRNIYQLDSFNDEEIKYTIKRWGCFLDYEFSDIQIDSIVHVCRGYPMLIRTACFVLKEYTDQNMSSDDLQIFLKNNEVLKSLFSKIDNHESGGFEMHGNVLCYEGNPLLKVLSVTEYQVLYLLYKYRWNFVPKDEIAKVLWPLKTIEMYSDAAIVQVIKRIRGALSKIGAPDTVIKAVYGKGYMLV